MITVYSPILNNEQVKKLTSNFSSTKPDSPLKRTRWNSGCRWQAAKEFNQHLAVSGRELTLRLAENEEEVLAAQKLRYAVFYEEMQAKPDSEALLHKLDQDSLDNYCQHLIVLNGEQKIVGTYRLVNRNAAREHGSFYTQTEYDISRIIAYDGEILELGRSCVAADYRTGVTMQLLWQGIANYVFAYGIEILFGCASLPGTDVDNLQPALSYLHHYHQASETLCPRAIEERYVRMDTTGKTGMDEKAIKSTLPPLIKGYLRVGGKVGDGAVIDWQFNTTDICLILKTEKLTSRYQKHFGTSSLNLINSMQQGGTS